MVLALIENAKSMAKKRVIEECILTMNGIRNLPSRIIKEIASKLVNPIFKELSFEFKVTKIKDEKYIVSNDEKHEVQTFFRIFSKRNLNLMSVF